MLVKMVAIKVGVKMWGLVYFVEHYAGNLWFEVVD